MGKSKECMDTVGDNNLLVSDVTAVFGRYIKYYVECYSTQTVKPCVNAFEIMLSAQAAMSSVQLPPPLPSETNVMYCTMMYCP